jgi:hypothetical protein
VLNFFNEAHDHWHSIRLEGDARPGMRLIQPEINRVIQT